MARSVLGALLLLLAANVSFSQAQEKKYFKVGGRLQLSPQPVSGPIIGIVWKYDKNLLAEWAKGTIPLTYYSKFKNRATLNTDTGVLEIRDMTTAETGLYSVEINNQIQSRVYQTVEINEVPRPEVSVQPLTCNRPLTCGLTCHGERTNTEPVAYFWKKDDGEWQNGEKRLNLTSQEMDNMKIFTCRMKNPVSQMDSEAFKSPFYQEKPQGSDSSPGGAIAGGVIGVLLFLGGAGVAFWKRKEIKQMIPCFTDTTSEQTTNARTPTGENKELIRKDVESGQSDNSAPPSGGSRTADPVQPNGDDAVNKA